jgi:acetyltransferase-like isoleucine patch superfamily enzyme
MMGMKIGSGTILSKLHVTWPHQILIGKNCLLEHNIFFKYNGVWSPGPSIIIGDNIFIGANCEFNIHKRMEIGNDTLIASGCKFIDHNHGINLDILMRKQLGPEEPIVVGCDVWIGVNTVILKGVSIGNGAIIAAGAVVTKSILPNEIWAGIPARKIGQRS